MKYEKISLVLCGVAICWSGVGFWPAGESKVWQVLNFSNLAIFSWCGVLALMFFSKREKLLKSMPDVSVWAVVVVSILSMAFAKNIGRSVGFNVKFVCVMIAGYSMVKFCCMQRDGMRRVYYFVTVCFLTAVCGELVGKYFSGMGWGGFHENGLKYGNYVSMMGMICGGYWIGAERGVKKIFGAVMIGAGVVSATSLGALAAMSAGVVTLLVMVKDIAARICLLGCFAAGVVLLFSGVGGNDGADSIKDDLRVLEVDGQNVRQRYIEWQGYMNILEDRCVGGTGCGAINERRSEYYYKLPKLNTLRAFDFNGWLGWAAEAGVWGLVGLCWVMVSYGKKNLMVIREGDEFMSRFARANFAALVAAGVGSIFCSFFYNGVLIGLVVILALTGATESICRCGYED